MKGFSERNLKRMVRFYREYPELAQQKSPMRVTLLRFLPRTQEHFTLESLKNRVL